MHVTDYIIQIRNATRAHTPSRVALTVSAFLVSVALFFLSIELISLAFGHISASAAQGILTATENPFVGLFIGTLMTAILQSSSTSTAMVVAAVGSGALTIEGAIPMVMGANIGTTLTSTLVALSYFPKRDAFRRGIEMGSLHDFFNIFTALLLWPLEHFTGFLHKVSNWLAHQGSYLLFDATDGSLLTPVVISRKLANWVASLFGDNFWVVLVLSIIVLFLSLRVFTGQVRRVLIGSAQREFSARFFNSSFSSALWGTSITALLQSSSLVSSLLVPMVAMRKISLRSAFPFLMGANIGTTLTALLAALYKTEAALSVAIIHVLFNLLGFLLFFPFKRTRALPLGAAKILGRLTQRSRVSAFLYILTVFFVLPFSLIFFSQKLGRGSATQEEKASPATSLERSKINEKKTIFETKYTHAEVRYMHTKIK